MCGYFASSLASKVIGENLEGTLPMMLPEGSISQRLYPRFQAEACLLCNQYQMRKGILFLTFPREVSCDCNIMRVF